MRINHIITESKNNIMLTETRTYKLWESAGQKIVEAKLKPDQITQLFQQIEQGATAAGSNRTVLGKGKDVASAVNKAWEDLKTKVQNTGPIKNVDAAYDQAAEKLKQATGGDAGVMKYVQKYRNFAKKHPIAQGLIYSALIAAAGISGAGAGGAAALGLLKMTDKLLQGEKFSSASYSGAKTGGMAYAAGKVGKAMKGNQQTDAPQSTAQTPKTDIATPVDHTDKVDNVTKTTKDVANNIAPTDTHTDKVKHVTKAAKDIADPDKLVPADKNVVRAIDKIPGHPTEYNGKPWSELSSDEKFKALDAAKGLDAQADAGHAALKAAKDTAKSSASDTFDKDAWQQAGNQVAHQNYPGLSNLVTPGEGRWGNINGVGSKATIWDKTTKQWLSLADANELAKSSTNESKQLNDSQISTLFYLTSVEQRLNEGVWDSVKGAVGKGLGKAASVAKTTGHNLTTKVTADKLMKAWKSAGSPTDSNEVASLLANSGVSQEVIEKVFASMKIPKPKAAKNTRKEPKVGDLSKMKLPSDAMSIDGKGDKSKGETVYSKVKSQLDQLNTKQKKLLAVYIQQQLGTA